MFQSLIFKGVINDSVRNMFQGTAKFYQELSALDVALVSEQFAYKSYANSFQSHYIDLDGDRAL
jgi:hypothetical protein